MSFSAEPFPFAPPLSASRTDDPNAAAACRRFLIPAHRSAPVGAPRRNGAHAVAASSRALGRAASESRRTRATARAKRVSVGSRGWTASAGSVRDGPQGEGCGAGQGRWSGGARQGLSLSLSGRMHRRQPRDAGAKARTAVSITTASRREPPSSQTPMAHSRPGLGSPCAPAPRRSFTRQRQPALRASPRKNLHRDAAPRKNLNRDAEAGGRASPRPGAPRRSVRRRRLGRRPRPERTGPPGPPGRRALTGPWGSPGPAAGGRRIWGRKTGSDESFYHALAESERVQMGQEGQRERRGRLGGGTVMSGRGLEVPVVTTTNVGGAPEAPSSGRCIWATYAEVAAAGVRRGEGDGRGERGVKARESVRKAPEADKAARGGRGLCRRRAHR